MHRSLYTLSILVFLAGVPISFAVRSPAGTSEAPAREAIFVADGDTLPAQLQEIIRTPSYVGEVVFPHLDHVDAFGIECEECHHETNAAALRVPHEEYFDDFWIDCTICHHASGAATLEAQACSNCHHASPREIADETLSAKVAIHESCWECHDSGTGVEASRNCVFCHSGPRTSFAPAQAESGDNP